MRRGGIELSFFLVAFLLIIVFAIVYLRMESRSFAPIRPQANAEIANAQAQSVLISLLRTPIIAGPDGDTLEKTTLAEQVAIGPLASLQGLFEQRIPEGYLYAVEVKRADGSIAFGEEKRGMSRATVLLPGRGGNVEVTLFLEGAR